MSITFEYSFNASLELPELAEAINRVLGTSFAPDGEVYACTFLGMQTVLQINDEDYRYQLWNKTWDGSALRSIQYDSLTLLALALRANLGIADGMLTYDSQRVLARYGAAPEGWPTVIPRIVVDGAEELVAFIKRVFDAEGEYHAERPTELRIGDSMLMISGSGARNTMTAFLYVYVVDTDATYHRAMDEGARSIETPFDTPYGDRRCMIEDRWGNTWQIATRG